MSDDAETVKALAAQFGMDYCSQIPQVIDPAIIALLPAHLARRYSTVPLARDGDRVFVAISDPLDIDTVDSLRYILKLNVDPVLASKSEIGAALKRFYS